MSVLTLDVGGTPITHQCQRGGHAAPRQVGTIPSSFNGGLTSSLRAELMVVPVVLQYLQSADVATIRTLFENGAQVDCSGDLFNNGGTTVTCSGTITDEVIQGATWWEVSLTLYEVGTSLL